MIITVQNLVSARTGEGIVELLADDKPLAKLTVGEAREIAQRLLEGAAVAECEAHLVRFLRQRIELSLEQAAAVLAAFRKQRG